MIVIAHAKLQINVCMLVSSWKWYSGIKRWSPSFPCWPVSRQCLKENPDRKKTYFSNAKWIWISLASLMIELYIYIYIYIYIYGLFSRKAEITWTRKMNVPYILSSSAKSCWVYTIIFISSYSAYIYLLLFQNMSEIFFSLQEAITSKLII